ncbi:MAG: hypothetical protein GF384_07345, partial [Elusimicrobia bacterium]|nr:hypothetical protein [Elusimicrobiota bacterium]
YGIVIENRNKIAVVSIDNETTSIKQEDAVLYDLPNSGASSVASLAYNEGVFHFINDRDEMRYFKARLNPDGTMTVLDTFDGAAIWGVGRIADIAFSPSVTPHLLVLTREDPVNGKPPVQAAKVMEVVVDDIPGHTKGNVIGHMDLVYENIPQPGGLTFDDEGNMYIVGSRTSAVQGEKDFTRFDPSIPIKPVVNQAPPVDAGDDLIITLPGKADLMMVTCQ